MVARKKTGSVAADGGDPLTVSVSLAVTLQVGENQYIKPGIEVRNIRVDQPVQSQVKAALEAVEVTWTALDSELEVRITEMTSGSVGQPTIRDSLDKVTSWIDSVAKKNFKAISEEVKKQQKRIATLEKEGP